MSPNPTIAKQILTQMKNNSVFCSQNWGRNEYFWQKHRRVRDRTDARSPAQQCPPMFQEHLLPMMLLEPREGWYHGPSGNRTSCFCMTAVLDHCGGNELGSPRLTQCFTKGFVPETFIKHFLPFHETHLRNNIARRKHSTISWFPFTIFHKS